MMLETQGSAVIRADDAQPAAPVRVPPPGPFRWKSIFLILIAALLANAAIVLVVLPEVRSRLALTYSMDFGDLYDLIGKNLDQGNGYRVDAAMGNTMLREPGYPLLLAAVFKLGGYGIQQARAACVLLAFGAALILLRLTRKITGDAMTALAGALLFLLYPGSSSLRRERALKSRPYSLCCFLCLCFTAQWRKDTCGGIGLRVRCWGWRCW